jgi:hypothetical protein
MPKAAYVKVDIEKTLSESTALEKEQFSFVLAQTLTQLAKGSQEQIREDMPSRFTLRSRWEQMGVRIEAAKKSDVRSSGSAEAAVKHIDPYMTLQEEGGDKRPKRKRSLAIPERTFQPAGLRTSSGAIAPRYRPKQLLKDYKGKDWYKQRHPGRKWGRHKKPKPFIMEHDGRVIVAIRRLSSRYPLTYLYVLSHRARVQPRFDFQKTVRAYVAKEYDRKFSENMLAALASRKGISHTVTKRGM